MAVTKIWAIRSQLNRLLNYVWDVDKTNGKSTDAAEIKAIENVIGYTSANYKTEKMMYVSGINVPVALASKQMKQTLENARKPSDIVAWHGVQSFAPGEVTPEQCHEIGVKLAEKLWGDKFEVVVATHIDRNHLHNHFVVNAASFIDGKRFLASKATYREMQRTSDEICREYSLSTIKNPKLDRTLTYDQWLADKNGEPTIRNRIRKDFDEAIEKSFHMNGFFSFLKEKGYQFRLEGKYPRVKAPFSERYLRLYKLGDRYELDSIERRLRDPREHEHREKQIPQRRYRVLHVRVKKTRVIFPGIRAFYYRTLYEFGVLPKGKKGKRFRKRSETDRRILQKVDRMSEELRVLSKYRISEEAEIHEKMSELRERLQMESLPFDEQNRMEKDLRVMKRVLWRMSQREKERN